jgi:hypothetical protein
MTIYMSHPYQHTANDSILCARSARNVDASGPVLTCTGPILARPVRRLLSTTVRRLRNAISNRATARHCGMLQ